ncbi:MAG: response regulator [Asticcacaulis sp.]
MRSSLDILLIEDNEGDVEMTRRALRRAEPPVTLSVANNGDEGLEALKGEGRFAEAARPQLILLDINMPRMDGKTFLRIVKSTEPFKAIPVVMFTSSESPGDIRECFEKQASAYVVKPFDGGLYAERLREVVNFWGAVGELPDPA